jgi:hypothetical protein
MIVWEIVRRDYLFLSAVIPSLRRDSTAEKERQGAPHALGVMAVCPALV